MLLDLNLDFICGYIELNFSLYKYIKAIKVLFLDNLNYQLIVIIGSVYIASTSYTITLYTTSYLSCDIFFKSKDLPSEFSEIQSEICTH